MKIERNDARKVDQKTLQFLRNRTIKLREAGHSNKEVAAILGVAIETTSRWYSSYKKNGKYVIEFKNPKEFSWIFIVAKTTGNSGLRFIAYFLLIFLISILV